MADFLYQGVVDWFLEQMSQGELTPGDKMPSLRKLAKHLELSLNTVIHGYDILAEQGWIESRPKSGYFVCHKAATKQAHLLAGEGVAQFDEALTKKMSWSALSHRAAFVDQSDEFLNPTSKESDSDLPILGKGHLSVREAVSEHLRKIAIKAHPSQVWLGRSPLAMYTQAIQTLTHRNDKILVITPCDPRLTSTGINLGRQVVTLAAGERGVDLDEAVRCLRDDDIRLVVFPSQFAFPAGIEVSNLSLRRWLAILQQLAIPAIEWDITSHLGYKTAPLMTYKSLDDKNQIVYIGGMESKGVDRNAAWCIPSQYRALESALLSADLALSDPQQHALMDTLQSTTHKHAIARRARQIWSLAEKAKAALEQCLGDRVRFAPSKGGLAIWLQCKQALAEDQLTQLVAKHRHGLVPGTLLSAQTDANQWLALNVTYEALDQLAVQLKHVIDVPVASAGQPQPDLSEASTTSEEGSIAAMAVATDVLTEDMMETDEAMNEDVSKTTLEEVIEHEQVELDDPRAEQDDVSVALTVEQADVERPLDELMVEDERDATQPAALPEAPEEPTKTVYNPMLDLINHDFG